MAIHQGNVEPLELSLVRILENGDTRFTEAGDTRVTNIIKRNVAESTLYSNAVKLDFFIRMFIKLDSTWKQFFPYAKVNGVWQVPLKMYKKIHSIWKRVY